MNRIVLWGSFLLIFLTLNIYLGWYSNSVNIRETDEQASVIAIQTEITPVLDEANNLENEVRLIFTGDVMLGRTVMTKSKDLNDYLYPFRVTAEQLSSADLTMVNLENPIINDCPIHTGGFTFCSEPESVSALEHAGVDIVTLANNHTYNWGEEGFDQTVDLLTKSGIESVGFNNIVYKEINNTRLAFMGIDFVTNPYVLDSEDVELIRTAKENSDFLIVNVHWGNEYQNSANSHQRNMAIRFVEQGADLIIGHHPHWVQDVECFNRSEMLETGDWKQVSVVGSITAEELNDGAGCATGEIPAYYSLGNFVFDQMWSEETKKGVAVEITLRNSSYLEHVVYPTYMNNWAQPEWVQE